jgi:hypothetical protein
VSAASLWTRACDMLATGPLENTPVPGVGEGVPAFANVPQIKVGRNHPDNGIRDIRIIRSFSMFPHSCPFLRGNTSTHHDASICYLILRANAPLVARQSWQPTGFILWNR